MEALYRLRELADLPLPASPYISSSYSELIDWNMLSRGRGFTHSLAPTCSSFTSDQSVDQVSLYKSGSNLDTASPAPTCSSVLSSNSLNRNVSNRKRPAQIPSPCMSFRSDQSMGAPILFKDKIRLKRHRSSSPSVSLNSCPFLNILCPLNGSTKNGIRPEQIPSPCLSFRSDQSMGAPILFKEIRCLLCNDVLKEPVTTPCGHNFCRTCRKSYWEKTIPESFCSCPQCGNRFAAFPDLKPNMKLDNLLKQAGYSPAQSYAGPGDMACDICTGSKIRAVKWCLTCSVAYCEVHVRQHYTVEALQKHILTDVTGDLKMTTCLIHHRALEVFCKTDGLFICLVCVIKEHKDHDTLLAKGGSHVAKANLTAELHQLKLNITECRMEITHLRNHNQELSTKVKRTESELSHLTKRFCRGLPEESMDFTSEFVEVAALGRQLDLGMLYDCCSDSYSSDITLWEKDLISSMKLTIPRPQTDVKILEKDTLQDRLAALDLSASQRASVVSGLVELAGASAFINHPIKSELQDQITLCYRTSSTLDMLSHEMLNRFPVSVTSLTKATHVVVAVLYGSQAFFVFNNKKERSPENTHLQDIGKTIIGSLSQTDLLSRLTANKKAFSQLYNYASFIEGDVLHSPVDTTVQTSGSVPLKVWLYPLKNLDQSSAWVAKDISEDQLCKAEKVLEKIMMDISFCQHLMSVDGGHDVFTMFPALKESLSEFSAIMQQYKSNFQRGLASCIKTIRETGEEKEQENLRELLDTTSRSPFSSQCTHQWLQNKNAQVRALIQCRSANITILNSQIDLQHFVQNCQAERVLCFIFTSVLAEDQFLSSLRQNAESVNMVNTTETQQTFRILDTSQRILSDLQTFIVNKETNESMQETMFVAAPVFDSHLSGSVVHLYQSGNLISQNVKLDVKPDPPEIVTVQETRVTIKLQRLMNQTDEHYTVEYRAVKTDMKWRVISCLGEDCVISGLVPETYYQLRYALKGSNGMTDSSAITSFQTASRARPGPPTVLKLNKESVYVAWQQAEPDEDSTVLYYRVEYLEVGLEGWQSIQTNGPICECTIMLPDSTCYRARVCAVYGNGDISTPSEETKVPNRVWSIDLSKRKASIFLKVLQLQTTKKSVKLKDCTDEESEVLSFLQCLPYISQMRFDPPQIHRQSLHIWTDKVKLFLTNLCLQGAIHQKETIQETMDKVSSCYFKTYQEQSAFLLDLFSCVKDYETRTGENVRPALQAVYQMLPEVWSINLSEKKASLFLEVLKLQSVKKAVELRGWSNEESEMRSLLQCLPYISQLRFIPLQPQKECHEERRTKVRRYLLDLCLQAALHQKEKIQTIVEKCFKTDKETSAFLLALYSHVKDYETQTGKSVLPALQTVYTSLPKIWSVNLSDKKATLFLEVLELSRPVKKAVELRGWSEDEAEMSMFLQCLTYISQLRFGFSLHGKRRRLTILRFLLNLIAGAAELSAETGESFTEPLASLCSFRPFSCCGDDQELDTIAQCNMLLDLYLHSKGYEAQTGRSVLPALQSIYESVPEVWTINLLDKKASYFLEVLKLQTVKKAVELTGWSNEKRKLRSFFQCLPHISQLRLCSDVMVRMAQTKALKFRPPVTLDELLLIGSSSRHPEGTPCKVLSNLNFLLDHGKIQCLNLTGYKASAESLIGLLNHQGPQSIRFSDETLQKLVEVVYEAQDEDLTRRFLQSVDGDLTSCFLSWDVMSWFLQHHTLAVEFRRSTIRQEDIQDVLPVLDKLHFRGLKSSFVLPVIRKLYEMSSAHYVSSLLRSTENQINLENRKLSSIDCAALRFTLEHCTAVSLNLLWTSIPEGELESIVPLLSHVSNLRVDRLLMLKLLHCCCVPELQQDSAVLLSALHHKLDFSCDDALDLTADTISNALTLNSKDCRVIAMAIQRAHTCVQLTVQDCEIDEAGVEELFPVLHRVMLQSSKDLLLRFLSLVHVGTEANTVRRAVALSQALRNAVDLSDTPMNLQAYKSLALILDYSKVLSELDLSNCQLTDQELELLMPHLYKTCVLDLSNNHITDASARNIYDIVSVNNTIQRVCLFNNRISDTSLFLTDCRFEIW